MPFSLRRVTHPLALAALLGVAAALVYFTSDTGVAQVAAPPTEFECRWADKPPVIDGKLDDAVWQQAQLIDNFYLPWLQGKARPARTATRARLLWDRDYLYFAADMDDTDLYADITEHDGMTWENDVFELFFKPAADKPAYYEFQVSANGTIMDMLIPRRGAGGYRRFIKDGDFHIDAKVVRQGTLNNWSDKDKGWTVEGRIPWKDFARTGGGPKANDVWRFTLCRYDYSVDFEGPELSTCAPLKSKNHADFHAHEDYAPLKFVGAKQGAAKPFGLEKRVPLTTSKVVGSPEPPPPFRAVRRYPNLKINYPIAIAPLPGSDQLFFITQINSYANTALRRMKDDPATSENEKLLDYDGVAYDLAFHPKFAENGFLYVGWNGPYSAPSKDKKTRVTRYTVDPKPPYKFDPKSAVTIIEWPSDGHNGGAIAFGLDGLLYVTSGDGTSDSDTNVKGQGMDHLLSKVLRIDVDHPAEGKQYSVPKDNPFVDLKDAAPETWAYGLRNPWRMTVDRKTGHLWVGNNGQDLWEQAYFVRKGDNFGWSVMEGGHPFYLNRKPGPTPFVKPTIEHHHSEFRSLTGGIVYHGEKYPELRGAYIYGDYSTGQIWAAKHDGAKLTAHYQLASTRLQISGFAADAKGEILICDHRGKDDGGFHTLEPTPKDDKPSTFPRTLSASGLFKSVKGHVMEPALIPYSVIAPLWSDGAHKERWFAMPGVETRIDFPTNRSWNFPDETVLVKSFALDMEEGNPASRRWIETRFLTKQQGEWFGYSYLWNDEGTEGTLVERAGLDREFTIKTANGERKQKWRYPSRSECMVCHSRAANFVLGLSDLQMNRDHDYGGVTDNQLRTLEHIGLFKVNWAEELRSRLREEGRQKGLTDQQADDYVKAQTPKGDPPTLALAPAHYRKLVDPYDAKADLDTRARSYLHANCAQCHVEAGGGNAQMELGFTTKAEKMRILDVAPVHHTFDIPDAKLVAPGIPERSVLLQRLTHRKAGFMPPLATVLVDQAAVDLLRQWIKEMPKK